MNRNLCPLTLPAPTSHLPPPTNLPAFISLLGIHTISLPSSLVHYEFAISKMNTHANWLTLLNFERSTPHSLFFLRPLPPSFEQAGTKIDRHVLRNDLSIDKTTTNHLITRIKETLDGVESERVDIVVDYVFRLRFNRQIDPQVKGIYFKCFRIWLLRSSETRSQ